LIGEVVESPPCSLFCGVWSVWKLPIKDVEQLSHHRQEDVLDIESPEKDQPFLAGEGTRSLQSAVVAEIHQLWTTYLTKKTQQQRILQLTLQPPRRRNDSLAGQPYLWLTLRPLVMRPLV